MKCQALMADASGSQVVPEPMRVIGMPKGRRGIPGMGGMLDMLATWPAVES